MTTETTQRIVTTPTKSMGTSIILSAILGPLGMFYSTILGGIIMTVISIILVPIIYIATLGLGLIVVWPIIVTICIVWAAYATSLYNKKLLSDTKF